MTKRSRYLKWLALAVIAGGGLYLVYEWAGLCLLDLATLGMFGVPGCG